MRPGGLIEVFLEWCGKRIVLSWKKAVSVWDVFLQFLHEVAVFIHTTNKGLAYAEYFLHLLQLIQQKELSCTHCQ